MPSALTWSFLSETLFSLILFCVNSCHPFFSLNSQLCLLNSGCPPRLPRVHLLCHGLETLLLIFFSASFTTFGFPHLPCLLTLEDPRSLFSFLCITHFLAVIICSHLYANVTKFISLAWISSLKYVFKMFKILRKQIL